MGFDVDSLQEAKHYVLSRLSPEVSRDVPLVGVVLGSGLGAFAERLNSSVCIPYADIPSMPTSAVAGHAGRLCWGELGEQRVACLQGRVHLYEGHPISGVVFGVRLLAELGCHAVLITNAAGGIAPALEPGDFMLLVDHINLSGENPLKGPNVFAGPRFPDMGSAYDVEVTAAGRRAAERVGRDLRQPMRLGQGVYAGVLGPSYETPAEVRMLRSLGADAVGMSTVNEVIALRHLGVRVGAVSCITNKAAGLGGEPLSHAEVEATARGTQDVFVSYMCHWIEELRGLR